MTSFHQTNNSPFICYWSSFCQLDVSVAEAAASPTPAATAATAAAAATAATAAAATAAAATAATAAATAAAATAATAASLWVCSPQCPPFHSCLFVSSSCSNPQHVRTFSSKCFLCQTIIYDSIILISPIADAGAQPVASLVRSFWNILSHC